MEFKFKLIIFLKMLEKMLLYKICLPFKKMKHGVRPNKVVFCNFFGRGYGCNPKYVCEELIRRKNEEGLDFELVWLVKDLEDTGLPPVVRQVPYNTIRAYIELVTAKFWVDNQLKLKFIENELMKSDKQVFIQTFHGSLGIKTLNTWVEQINNDPVLKKSERQNSRMTDYLISNSSFETEVYKSAFSATNTICEFGHPRNDIFFKPETELKRIKQKVCDYYGINSDTKILFYAPTFRDKNRFSTEYFKELNHGVLLDTLKKQTGQNWVFVVRLHPHVALQAGGLSDNKDACIDASKYPDIQELLAAADMMITDYSSCIFDFVLTKKPGFIFAPDLEEYNNDRGFYYPLETTPFPIAQNNDELIKNIKNFDQTSYVERVDEFLKDKGCKEDGLASKRVVDLILSLSK